MHFTLTKNASGQCNYGELEKKLENKEHIPASLRNLVRTHPLKYYTIAYKLVLDLTDY